MSHAMATARTDWAEANQRHLMAALGRLQRRLEAHADKGVADRGPTPKADTPGASDARDAVGSYALQRLCDLFGLSEFERDLLLMCAGMELDAAFAELVARAHGDPARDRPDFSLALAVLPDAHWSALTPSAPLRHWRLIDIRAGDTLVTSPLRIDERVLHYLTGLQYLRAPDRLRAA